MRDTDPNQLSGHTAVAINGQKATTDNNELIQKGLSLLTLEHTSKTWLNKSARQRNQNYIYITLRTYHLPLPTCEYLVPPPTCEYESLVWAEDALCMRIAARKIVPRVQRLGKPATAQAKVGP